jgi:anti-sigma factor RsiW
MVDFLMAYLEGELPESERASFEVHLQICPPCVVYLETYQEAVRLGKSLCRDDSDALPDDVPEGLVEAILAARSRSA